MRKRYSKKKVNSKESLMGETVAYYSHLSKWQSLIEVVIFYSKAVLKDGDWCFDYLFVPV
jgi:hypothetical protein